MLWLKACPRCGGDLRQEGDICGLYACCLQCAREFTSRKEGASRPYPLQPIQTRSEEGECQRKGGRVANVG